MSKDDISKCKYKYEDNCTLYDNKCMYITDCNHKQIQQLKAENEELKKKKEENTTFYLKKYANKDSECLELQHKVNILKQTLAENEELKKQLQEESDLGHKAVQEEADSFFEALRYKHCLDEIEEYCKEEGWQNYSKHFVETGYILQKIKEVKDNG